MFQGVIINSVYFSSVGDLKIQLSNGHVIEIFVNATSDKECWRFFESNTKKAHLVFKGTGPVFQ